MSSSSLSPISRWIRQDRILHEALTSSADLLRLALVFGISYRTAMTYAYLARDPYRPRTHGFYPGSDHDSTGRFDPHHLQSG